MLTLWHECHNSMLLSFPPANGCPCLLNVQKGKPKQYGLAIWNVQAYFNYSTESWVEKLSVRFHQMLLCHRSSISVDVRQKAYQFPPTKHRFNPCWYFLRYILFCSGFALNSERAQLLIYQLLYPCKHHDYLQCHCNILIWGQYINLIF